MFGYAGDPRIVKYNKLSKTLNHFLDWFYTNNMSKACKMEEEIKKGPGTSLSPFGCLQLEGYFSGAHSNTGSIQGREILFKNKINLSIDDDTYVGNNELEFKKTENGDLKITG